MTAEAGLNRWRRWVTACGFHPPLLAFAMRTTLAGGLAFLLAYGLGLEHPHWAAMSAWASSQPLREHLRSRGLYRIGGSVVGVGFAVALVLLAQGSIWVLGMGLALWCAGCAWAGNLQRGYRVYGCMLAGYSAAMVVLLQQGPVQNIWPFAADRMLTVITGALLALCVAWFFSSRRESSVLIQHNRQALAQVLDAAVLRLRQQPTPPDLDNVRLLTGLAAVEELLELYAEGSRKARHTALEIHHQQHQAMELVYRMNSADTALPRLQSPEALADALSALTVALRHTVTAQTTQYQHLAQKLQQAIGACEQSAPPVLAAHQLTHPPLGALYQLLQSMRKGLHAEQLDMASVGSPTRESSAATRTSAPPLHRDGVGAWQAAVRVGGTLLLLGLVWAVTGWPIVAFGMLGLSVMLLVFSAFENPQHTMAFVLRGQLIGASLALLCQWWVWPLAQNGWQMVFMALPFALLAGLFFAHKRTAAGGMDTNMVMLILLAPTFPYANDMGHNLGMALAIVSGPALAWLVYRWVYPTNAQQRMRALATTMVAEVPALAQKMQTLAPGASLAAPQDPHAQMHHRMLKLVRWGVKTNAPHAHELPALWLALRSTQTALWDLYAWRQNNVGITAQLRRTERMAALALRRLAAPGAAMGAPTVRAWQQLSTQVGLPEDLAASIAQVAQKHLPVIAQAQQRLQLAQRPGALSDR